MSLTIAANQGKLGDPSQIAFPIGIVIPTYNRIDALMTCLYHLERQTMPDFEVVVVDDGSSDSTAQRIREYQDRTPLRLRYVAQPNSGPARARNLGISMLRAPICIFIGDDIFAAPDFVAVHLQLHSRRTEIQVAGLGLTLWSETGQKVTKFMRWLDTSGNQFAYGELLAGIQPNWKHFYTSNLSVKTELLTLYRFDETFHHAAYEDVELGYRIQSECGLEIIFLKDAVCYHLHPTTFRAACRRMSKLGESAQILYKLWPELRPASPSGFRRLFYRLLLRYRWLMRPLILASDCLSRVWCPNPLMRITLAAHHLAGEGENSH